MSTQTLSPAYVRSDMLPAAAPPHRQEGAISWLRDNLFSGWFNSLLTLLGLAIIWSLVSHFWPWFAHSVWNANSLAECRQIIAEKWGDGANGACFAVIRVRWHQYIFGFYPRAEYWRPILTMGLLFVAIAPVLFSVNASIRRWVLAGAGLLCMVLLAVTASPDWSVVLVWLLFAAALLLAEYAPGRLLIVTVFYPVLAVWLLWGGSPWYPFMLLMGFAVGYGVSALVPRGMSAATGIVVTVLWWVFRAAPVAGLVTQILPLSLPAIQSSVFGGFLLSVVIGVSAIALSLPLGILLALARQSNMFIIYSLAVVFIEFIRGVPLITLLFVALVLLKYFLPPGTNFDLILRVIIMVTLFAAAYMAEVIRGGLAALPRGQYEAADSLGLNYWQAQRLIILPQALKISIPGIVGTFIGVFKDTTLVGLINLYDPLKGISDVVRSEFAWKGIYWEPFIFTGTIFFVICFSMSRYSMYLERRLSREHR
ncbi:amino acid ABC transporter permease [Paracoccus xiamenensis]|uniref:amino acid ABC transporter permease n=1 Tax=Paracoccus xiamenensis TaxID=2714901 RepID=UPI0014073DEE|nr:amino acid ABC transporter permease [Paracoccus xiamenensis]NHF74782.1 amino acid ABC transporter permease [Paracoccus xiamenensis]